MQNKRVIIGIGIMISFALLIFSVSLYYNNIHNEKLSERLDAEKIKNMSTEEINSHFEENRDSMLPPFYLLPFVAFVGVLVGTIVYYVMADKIIHQKTTGKNNAKVILNFLNQDERKIITILLENEGKVRQYEVSNLPGLNKVKSHRILKSLKEKDIITSERMGKVNQIILNKDLYEVLSN